MLWNIVKKMAMISRPCWSVDCIHKAKHKAKFFFAGGEGLVMGDDVHMK